MKGIAHFVTGVAVATFFPEIVHSASQNLSFAPLLGGVAGLLPDTLDFKFFRYFYRLDEEIDPAKLIVEVGHPDPQLIAERVASALNRAYEQSKQVRIHLHTLKLGADLWRQYDLTFDLARNDVVVHLGPLVTTAQVPYVRSDIPGLKPGRARVGVPILPTYDAPVRVDVFSGPTLAFERLGDALEVTFMPWHRAWTHSLAMALFLGAVGFLFAPVYGWVIALASLAHIIEDQLGYMGSNLLFPFTRRRLGGLQLVHSGDATSNFLTVWISLAVVLLNLDRFSSQPTIPIMPYVLGAILMPCLFFLGLSACRSWVARRQQVLARGCLTPDGMAAIEALDETREMDI
jgi:membrane-bound metal-dependent hydrolase YbcI (DUF457 family)